MRLSCYLCVKKGLDTAFVRRLLTTQRGGRDEQVSIAPH
jgi:hypothetical protein